MPFIDNGDGTVTTEDGVRIAKPYGMGQPPPFAINPDILAAAQRPPDARTASADDVIRNSLAPPSAPDAQAPLAPLDMKRILSPEEAAKIATEAKASRPAASDAAKAAAALGVEEPGLPKGLRPAVRASAESGTVSPEDRVQVGGTGYSIPDTGPRRVIDKGGMRPVQETIQKGIHLPQELKDQADANVMSHRAANQVMSDASASENKATAEAAGGYATTAEQQLAKEQERAALHQRTMADAMGKFDAMSNEARTKPINDDAYWQEKGAGARVLSGLWIAMGELSKGKGENTAKSMIDKQIDTWIAGKRESRAQGLAGQQSLVNQARDNFQSETAQNAAMRAQGYDAYRAKLASITANAATEKEKAQALELDARLQDSALAERTKAAEAEADHVTVHEKLVAPTVSGGNQPYAKNDGSFLDLPDGSSIKASSPEMANQWREQLGGINEIKAAENELRRLLADPTFKDAGRVKVLLNNISTANGAAKLGTARQTGMGEMHELKDIFDQNSNVSSDVWGRTRSALGAVRASAQRAEDGILKAAPRYSRGIPDSHGEINRLQMFPNGGGGHVPIAFEPVGRGKKAKK